MPHQNPRKWESENSDTFQNEDSERRMRPGKIILRSSPQPVSQGVELFV